MRQRDDLNRGDYRGDFGPEGRDRFRHDDDRRREADDDAGGEWRGPGSRRAGWRRGLEGGGYGSQYDAWRSGAGFPAAGFGFGPGEDPDPRGSDAQPTRPARGRGAWAGDWSDEDYRGRGPRDFRRSDDRLREEVCERLTDDWAVDATEISVQVVDGEVTLTGIVPSREQRRRAEECVDHVSGVRDVFNQLRVQADEPRRAPQRAGRR